MGFSLAVRLALNKRRTYTLSLSLLVCLSITAFAFPVVGGTAQASQGTASNAQDHHMAAALKQAATAAGANVSLNYDEQLGLTYTQNFPRLGFNVTAVEQSFNDSYGAGPGYLVCGLSNSGYWYEVGLGWNWPLDNGGYSPGFSFMYEVFDLTGNSIFPTDGGLGLLNFSAPVNSNDNVYLALSFSGGNVTMTGHDWNNKANAAISYSAEGATYFAGSQSDVADSNGFFTGLLTEQYHASAYYGNMKEVVYSESGTTYSSAWMWMDEYNSVTGQTQFFDQTILPVSFANPTQFQQFSSHGATEYSDAFGFITGPMSGTTTTTSSTTSSTTSTAQTTSSAQTTTITTTATITSTSTQTLTTTTTNVVTSTLPGTTTTVTTILAITGPTTTVLGPGPTVTSTSTATQTVTSATVLNSSSVPAWVFAMMTVLLVAGVAAGYLVKSSSATKP
jgi:hypothetical protein